MNNYGKENKFIAPMEDIYPLLKKTVDEGGEFRMITAGTSMLPLLHNRKDTVVLIKPTFPLKKYDIPLYRRGDGTFVLHRIIKVKDRSYVMCGDNQINPESGITEENIIAKVSVIIRNGKIIDLQKSFLYKLYVTMWCRMYFLRYVYIRTRNAYIRRKKRKNT